MRVRVHVTPRKGVLDPQGAAVEQGLAALGFDGVSRVRVGRVIDFDLATDDAAVARDQARAMAKKLLANEVVEDFDVELLA